MKRKWMKLGFPLLTAVLFLVGCGTQAGPPNSSFIVNQISGPTRTSFNGELIRTRSYDGIRNYGQDNVTLFVTGSDGESVIYNLRP